MRHVLLASLLLSLCATGAYATGNWRIARDHWTPADEAGFGRFVAAIGASNCSSSESCLRDPSNPYRRTDRKFVDIDVDCAKLPFLLRGYYAWKHRLPFGYVDAVRGNGSDLRHTHTANNPISRREIVDRGDGVDGPAELRHMLGQVYSATYRTDPARANGLLSDFYSPALKPGSIRPGSVVYDVNGHVGIVWKVDEDGRIYYMDAHPDFTITRSIFGAQFGRSAMSLGGGLKNWRPFRLAGARRVGGHLVGGHYVYARNDEIGDFALTQYLGTEQNPARDVGKARFFYEGSELGFYEYVRVAVSGGKTEFNPVFELRSTMKTLCNDLRDRALYVDLAIKDGIAGKPHPRRLPDDILDATGDPEWEAYSTPARDARIRDAAVQFYKDMSVMIDMWVHRDMRIAYDGNFLRDDLARTYAQQSQACTITYLNSESRPVAISFDDMLHRLFAMSFDPYHCVELRWGASGDERRSCSDGTSKIRWYEVERRRRGESEALVDIKSLIGDIPDRVGLARMAPVGR